MLHQRLGPWGRSVREQRPTFNLGRIDAARWSSAFAVLDPFLFPALRATVIGDAALGGLLSAVGLLAAEGAAQILPPGIAGIDQQENAATPTTVQASSQMRFGSAKRSQEEVICQDQSPHLGPSIPSSPKLKMLRDPDCKKPKLRLGIPTPNWMSSSYSSRHLGVEAIRRGLPF